MATESFKIKSFHGLEKCQGYMFTQKNAEFDSVKIKNIGVD